MNDLVNIGKHTRFKSGEHAAKSGAAGGRASGKARKEKKTMRQMVEQIIVAKPPFTDELRNELSAIGLTPDSECTAGFLSAVALVKKAMKGDIRALQLWLEITGQDPKVMIERDRLALEKQNAEHVPGFAALDAAVDMMVGDEK